MHLLILFGVFSITSGLVLPMTKPDGSVDMASVLSHVTLLEHTLAIFQKTATHMEAEMKITKSELQTVRSNQRHSDAEITSLKDELAAVKAELGMTSTELISVKSELKSLKTECDSLKAKINSTISNYIDTEMKTELSTISSITKQMQSNVATAADIGNITRSVMTLYTQLLTTNSDVSMMKNDLDTMKRNMTSLDMMSSDELKAMDSKINRLTDLNYQFTHGVQSNTAAIQLLLSNSRNMNESLYASIIELSRIKENVSKVSSELNHQHSVVTPEMFNMSSALNQVQSGLFTTTNSLNHVQGNIRILQSELGTTTGDISQIRSDMASLRQNMSGLVMTSHGNSQALAQISQCLDSKEVTFSVYLNSSALSGSFTPLRFESIHYNSNDTYNPNTGKFTAPVSGTYLFSVQVLMNVSNQHTFIQVVQSDTVISESWGRTSADFDYITIPVTTVSYVKQGEQVWIASSGDVNILGSGYRPSHFAGALLRAH